ncbi:MAG: sufU [Rickettsiales bacterium]|jgi:nitrogen fixation NifU-like protein|nr:sufU [Rickettsiales bacterium]
MTDLRDLYQELILDHAKAPHNFGALTNATTTAKGHNPLCGDQLDVYLLLEDGRVKDVRFAGTGCAISMASASLMTDAIKGKTKEEAMSLFTIFHALVTTGEIPSQDLGKLGAFAGVRDYPVRVKCATLAWHTLDAALAGEKENVTTE